jgi:hypothetical protein
MISKIVGNDASSRAVVMYIVEKSKINDKDIFRS